MTVANGNDAKTIPLEMMRELIANGAVVLGYHNSWSGHAHVGARCCLGKDLEIDARERTERCGGVAQRGVDRRRGKPKSLELTRSRWIRKAGALSEQGIQRARAALLFMAGTRLHGLQRQVAIDPSFHELAHEARVADRLPFPLNVELRKQPIVEKPLVATTIDGATNSAVVESTPFQLLPELRLRQSRPRQQP